MKCQSKNCRAVIFFYFYFYNFSPCNTTYKFCISNLIFFNLKKYNKVYKIVKTFIFIEEGELPLPCPIT